MRCGGPNPSDARLRVRVPASAGSMNLRIQRCELASTSESQVLNIIDEISSIKPPLVGA